MFKKLRARLGREALQVLACRLVTLCTNGRCHASTNTTWQPCHGQTRMVHHTHHSASTVDGAFAVHGQSVQEASCRIRAAPHILPSTTPCCAAVYTVRKSDDAVHEPHLGPPPCIAAVADAVHAVAMPREKMLSITDDRTPKPSLPRTTSPAQAIIPVSCS
eukprot:2279688-Prymnesium_polylepis.1